MDTIILGKFGDVIIRKTFAFKTRLRPKFGTDVLLREMTPAPEGQLCFCPHQCTAPTRQSKKTFAYDVVTQIISGSR